MIRSSSRPTAIKDHRRSVVKSGRSISRVQVLFSKAQLSPNTKYYKGLSDQSCKEIRRSAALRPRIEITERTSLLSRPNEANSNNHPILSIFGNDCNHCSPIFGMKSAFSIDSLKCVCSEVVALGLDEVCGEPFGRICGEIIERRGKRERRQARVG